MAKNKMERKSEFIMSIPENDLMRPMERWIGLAEVRAHPDSDLLAKGYLAFVPVVGDAADKQEFFRLASAGLATLQLELIRLEDVEPLAVRRRKYALPDQLETAIERITNDARLAYGSLHIFPEAGREGAEGVGL